MSSTKLVQNDWIQDDASITFCPLIYQRFIERKYDYRVVVLGNSVFVSRCNSTTSDQEDVRVNNKTGDNFYKHNIQTEQIEKLKKLMGMLGINYCAADFIEDHDGNIFFLEMNICGAWWWMDKLHKGKILDAFVKYLTT